MPRPTTKHLLLAAACFAVSFAGAAIMRRVGASWEALIGYQMACIGACSGIGSLVARPVIGAVVGIVLAIVLFIALLFWAWFFLEMPVPN